MRTYSWHVMRTFLPSCNAYLFAFISVFICICLNLQCSELMAGMLILGDREHQGRKEGVEAYVELNKVEDEARAAAAENVALKALVEKLEQEVSDSRAAEAKAETRVAELVKEVEGFEAAREALRLEAVDVFRLSSEYAGEVGAKAAANIHDSYVVAEKHLKERPDGDFDGFIEVFLAAEEEKARDPQDTGAADDPAQ